MIKIRTFEEIVILDVLGSTSEVELTQKGELNDLLRHIDGCYEQNRRQIIVNLESVSNIDSDAVAALALKRGSREGILIRFYGMQSKVKHALRYTGFLTMFQVHESQRDATQSFK